MLMFGKLLPLLINFVILVRAARPKGYSADLELHDAEAHDLSADDAGFEAAVSKEGKAPHNASSHLRSYLQTTSRDPKPFSLEKCLEMAEMFQRDYVYYQDNPDPSIKVIRMPIGWHEHSWFMGSSYQDIKLKLRELLTPEYVTVPPSSAPQKNRWRDLYRQLKVVKVHGDSIQKLIGKMVTVLKTPGDDEVGSKDWNSKASYTKQIVNHIIKYYILAISSSSQQSSLKSSKSSYRTLVRVLLATPPIAQEAVVQAYKSPELNKKFANYPTPRVSPMEAPGSVKKGTFAPRDTPLTLANKVMYAFHNMREQWLMDLVEYCTPDDDDYKMEDELFSDELLYKYPYEEDIMTAKTKLDEAFGVNGMPLQLPMDMVEDWTISDP